MTQFVIRKMPYAAIRRNLQTSEKIKILLDFYTFGKKGRMRSWLARLFGGRKVHEDR